MIVFHLECDDYFFGINCKQQCNPNCDGCNKKTGVCDTGCKPGWKGISCQESKTSYESLINNLNDLAAHSYLRREITFLNIVDAFFYRMHCWISWGKLQFHLWKMLE